MMKVANIFGKAKIV